MKLAIGLGNQTSLEKEIELTKKVEEAGLFGVSIAEHIGLSSNDVFATIAMIAHQKSSLFFIVNSVNQYSRHPVTLAMAATTAAEATEGKLILGLGTGAGDSLTKMKIDDSHSLSRLKEVILITDALTQGKEFSFNGKFFSLEAMKLPLAGRYKLQIFIPAIRDKAISLAAEYGNGIFLSNCSSLNFVRHANKLISQIRKKSTEFGIASSLTYVPTLDKKEGLRLAKMVIMRYLSIPGIGETLLERSGFDANIATSVRNGENISDEIAEALTVVGEFDDLQKRAEEFSKAGVTLLIVSTPADMTKVINDVSKLKVASRKIRTVRIYFS